MRTEASCRLLGVVAALLIGWVAPSAAAQKVGTTSFQFLKVMPVARATAMGDAYAALARGAEALFWNPAGLALTDGIEVTGTHIPYLVDTRISSAGLAFALGDFGRLGLQIQYVDYGDLVETRTDLLGFNADGTFNPGLTGNTFSPQAWAFGLSYGRALNDQFRIGLTGKYVYESLYNGNTTFTDPQSGAVYNTGAGVLLFDFGLQYDTGFRSLQLGAAVQNFGAEVAFVEESFAAPLTFRLGVAANLIGPGALLQPHAGQRLTVVYDLHQPNDYDQQMHLGLEYAFAEVLTLRAGRKLNYDTENWTFGGGIRLALGSSDFSFDYSYSGMSVDLGVAHRLTLSARLK
ncbi:PorV/PorQ family protein [Rhodocaloribacter litoris]|uniref:PorV/PorQ family protein n=1 Tax=Rhodocaloribacter litoris TaxID=2558931 RepID=UPI0014200792|nr:PorV/PorQ family protein [Rhodocaloribacter litoris]QXD14091.1 PorV/PorQ family protein [Rhodocaloribacter litoris]